MSLLFGRQRRANDGALFTGQPYRVGERITTGTVGEDAALGTVAYFASIDLLASLLSTTPLHCYRTVAGTKNEIDLPGWLADPAGDGQGLEDWLYQLLFSFLQRGNVVGEVLDRDVNAWPTQVSLLDFSRFRVRRVDGKLVWTSNGVVIPNANLWHRRAYTVPGALVGLSPLEMHARTLGIHLAAQKFGNDFFAADAAPVATIESDQPIDQKTAREIKDRVTRAWKNREPATLGRGLKYVAHSVTAEESQFLATQGYTAAEVARIFGPGVAEILGYESGSSMTYANVESRSIHLQVYALQRWFVRVERAISDLLPRGQTVRFDLKAMMRSTTLERFQSHALGISSHFMLPDEARAEENLPPLPDGEGQKFPADIKPPETPPFSGKPPK